MGRPRGSTNKKTATAKPELVFEDGHYWIVSGTKRLDVGISRRYAEKYLAELAK